MRNVTILAMYANNYNYTHISKVIYWGPRMQRFPRYCYTSNVIFRCVHACLLMPMCVGMCALACVSVCPFVYLYVCVCMCVCLCDSVCL